MMAFGAPRVQALPFRAEPFQVKNTFVAVYEVGDELYSLPSQWARSSTEPVMSMARQSNKQFELVTGPAADVSHDLVETIHEETTSGGHTSEGGNTSEDEDFRPQGFNRFVTADMMWEELEQNESQFATAGLYPKADGAAGMHSVPVAMVAMPLMEYRMMGPSDGAAAQHGFQIGGQGPSEWDAAARFVSMNFVPEPYTQTMLLRELCEEAGFVESIISLELMRNPGLASSATIEFTTPVEAAMFKMSYEGTRLTHFQAPEPLSVTPYYGGLGVCLPAGNAGAERPQAKLQKRRRKGATSLIDLAKQKLAIAVRDGVIVSNGVALDVSEVSMNMQKLPGILNGNPSGIASGSGSSWQTGQIQAVFCRNCGGKAKVGFRFCSFCGSAL
mmetsp:Transcript_10716/g.28487  ORF Transcript_10716/g.28487 Transcript_10716/m.28487 type:complete len:387 (-) Transcript_10716:368-1528(-)